MIILYNLMSRASYLIFGSMGCGYCRQAKLLLETHKKSFKFIDIYSEPGKMLLDNYRNNNIIDKDFRTMPMIVKQESKFIGGFDNLSKYLNKKQRKKSKKSKRKTKSGQKKRRKRNSKSRKKK